MPRYMVWDELNDEEAGARPIVAYDAQDAAKEFARTDSDGNTDGIYVDDHGNPKREDAAQPICVRDTDGALTRWGVYIEEFTPVFSSVRLS